MVSIWAVNTMKFIFGHMTCDKRKLDMQSYGCFCNYKSLSEIVCFCKINTVICSPFNELFL